MMKIFRIILPLTLIFTNLACSSLDSSEPTSSNLSISDSTTEVAFSGDVNTTQYHTITFANDSSDNYVISNLAFVGNDCGAFSVYNITDSSDNILYTSGDTVAIGVVASAKVSINLQFSPTACDVKTYTTTLIVYYTDNGATKTKSVNLNASVTDNTTTTVCPEKATVSYNDQLGDPTPSRKLPTLPTGEYYYLKIDRIRAYIQPTGGFTSMAAKVGTDINADDVPEEKQFTPVYLPFTTDDAGTLTLEVIDSCAGFAIPSPSSDPYFWGATVTLTSDSQLTGTVDRTTSGRIGEITFKNFMVRLSADIDNTASLLQDSNGKFGIYMVNDLTTADSATNSYLADIVDELDDSGEPLLNISADGDNSVLMGSDLYHGTARFVGVGTFEGTNAMLSPEATSALLDSPAYLFIQIDAEVVTLK